MAPSQAIDATRLLDTLATVSNDGGQARDPAGPLLTLATYAIACGHGLSSRTWHVCDEHGTPIITAERFRDPVRSLLIGCVLVAACSMVGVSIVAVVATSAAYVAVGALVVSTTAVVLLAPIVALRRRKPVVLRRAGNGEELLRIEQRTRFGIANVVREVRTPSGVTLGHLTNTPIRQAFRTAWRIDAPSLTPLMLTEPSQAAALGTRLARASIAFATIGSIYRGVLAGPGPSRSCLVLKPIGVPEPVASCVEGDGAWTWLTFTPGRSTAPDLRPLTLAVCLLALSDDRA